MSSGRTSLGPCQTYSKRSIDGFIARPLASDVGHPAFSFVTVDIVAATPLHVYQTGEATTLIAVPACV